MLLMFWSFSKQCKRIMIWFYKISEWHIVSSVQFVTILKQNVLVT